MAFSINKPRLARRALRVLGVITIVIVLAWLGMAWYVNAHKKEILAELTQKMSERMRGDLHIEGMEPSMFRAFPDVELSLKNVSLRDSLWTQHHRSLLEAKSIFLRINPFALLTRRVEISKLTIAHGAVYLFTDSNGYANAYLLSQRDTTKTNRTALVDKLGMEDMHFWMVNAQKAKLFHFYFPKLNAKSHQSGGVMQAQLSGTAHVFSMAFSTIRGSYLKDQDLAIDLKLEYRISDKHLHIPDQSIGISGTPIILGADFHFNRTPAAFAVHLAGKNVPFKKARAWTSGNIQKVLMPFDFAKPVSLDISVSGEMKYKTIPLIRISYPIVDNILMTPAGNVEHLNYTGEYFNEAQAGAGHGDDNSRLGIYRYKGEWQGLPFHGDTITVTNLLKPVVNAHILSNFPVTALNDVTGGDVLHFERGQASADLRYTGGIKQDDPTPYAINGYVKVANAGLSYVPRNLAFDNVGATLFFKDDNLFLRNITAHNKQSSLSMEGDALHILRLYFADPGKVTVAWRMRSPMINLNDYLSLLGRRRSVAAGAGAAPRKAAGVNTRIGAQLDNVLAAASFSLDARIDRAVYLGFNGDAIIARASMGTSGVFLQQIQIRNGSGVVTINASVNQAAANNPFHLKAQVRNADVAKLFASFDNFGQDALTASNLAGRITADADITGNVTDAGKMLPKSLNGTVTFKLEDGALNRFAPLEKVSKYVFKKRNLSQLNIKQLAGKLDIRGNKIFIPPMNIETSAINMNIQGVYGLEGGTDIAIEVPLRNPEKEGAATPIGMLLRRGKGFVVNLRAQDPDGKGVRIGWDPKKKGRKSTDEVLNAQ